jgi:rSAM/selenodomain-associated transferase 2
MHSEEKLSAVIPMLDAAALLPDCLASLDEGRNCGLLREIIAVDGGSVDGTPVIAATLGARVLSAPQGRGTQLAAGAAAAAAPWLLFLHADTRLAPGWATNVADFLGRPENSERAGYFRLRLDDAAPAARRLERVVAFRARFLGLPYGDQGLLVPRRLYQSIGGFRPLPLMEDVDLVRRLGRHRLVALDAIAVSSTVRYRRAGYTARMARNLACLSLYFIGLPPRLIAKLYG